ncbi:hypothetical protein ABZX92_36770, partial [Lentzea sp. NPDC006480]|uniref:hypothetical protein n=1 Tax=Lentzea sp. NPDC006480 TaxID=3157176 RepID=UPI0033B0FCFF
MRKLLVAIAATLSAPAVPGSAQAAGFSHEMCLDVDPGTAVTLAVCHFEDTWTSQKWTPVSQEGAWRLLRRAPQHVLHPVAGGDRVQHPGERGHRER